VVPGFGVTDGLNVVPIDPHPVTIREGSMKERRRRDRIFLIVGSQFSADALPRTRQNRKRLGSSFGVQLM
jgi:hypothetical protein